MVRKILLVITCLTTAISCGSDPSESESEFTREDVIASLQGKGDSSLNEKICKLKGLPSTCDICEVMNWYPPFDTTCDPFCPKPDSACGGKQCVQQGTSCCVGTTCNNVQCPSGYSVQFTGCSTQCVAQGTCVPNGSPDPGNTSVTIMGNGEYGYTVRVDGKIIGTEGQAPLDSVQDGTIRFQVKGNAWHIITVNVDRPEHKYFYNNYLYFKAGEATTITLGDLNPTPTPVSDTRVTIKANWFTGYEVRVDGTTIGGDGRNGDSLDGNFSFSVKGNMNHQILIWDGDFNYTKDMYFQSGVDKEIRVDKGTWGPGSPANPSNTSCAGVDCESFNGCGPGGLCDPGLFVCVSGCCLDKLCVP